MNWTLVKRLSFLIYCLLVWGLNACTSPKAGDSPPIQAPPLHQQSLVLPFLASSPTIDGDLSEWAEYAFSDGVWDLTRLRHAAWYKPDRNRLADHEEAASVTEDLSARYYMAWDSLYLYLGAAVHDNVNDVSESRHAPKRWYYKDAITWFIEAPKDTLNEAFGEGDHGFAFVIDTTRPAYGAWWRHGTADTSFLEEPLPTDAVDYALRMNPWGHSPADYILEARIELSKTLGQSDPNWHAPQVGDEYAMMIVHCDPDGGEYGGHLLIYGQGDPDSSWTSVRLTGPQAPLEQRSR